MDKAKLEKLLHEKLNLIPTENVQKAIIEILKDFDLIEARNKVLREQNYEMSKTTVKLEEALVDTSFHFIQRTFSNRPCSTCQLITDITGEPFGCNLKALGK